MQPWFSDAKLGIFIHYGVYAVDGWAESWSFYTGEVTHEQYMKQLDRFTASHYDPTAWAELFARVGAKYAVLTTKHHDGVALWDTGHRNLDVVRNTPAGRDLVTGFVDALRERDLKVGLYYSHSDWNHPDYPSVRHVRPGEPPAPSRMPSWARRTRRPGSATSPTATARSANSSSASAPTCSGSTANGSVRRSSGGCGSWPS